MNYVVDLFLLFDVIVEAKFVLRVAVVVSFPDFVFLFYYAVDLCLLFDFIVAIFSKFVLRVVLVVRGRKHIDIFPNNVVWTFWGEGFCSRRFQIEILHRKRSYENESQPVKSERCLC